MDVTQALGLGEDLFNVGYSLYQDQRNFNYEKQLQQQIFDREDSAWQRAAADINAAGLSKGILSSGNSSGSVLGASSTGVKSDIVSNYQQRAANALSLKQQAKDYSISQYQEDVISNQAADSALNYAKNRMDFLSTPGIKDYNYNPNTGRITVDYDKETLKAIKQQRYDAEMKSLEAGMGLDSYKASLPLINLFLQALGTSAQIVK